MSNSGVFPLTSDFIFKWCMRHREAAKELDLAVVWQPPMKRFFLPTAAMFESIDVLSPWYWNDPWSRYLENRTVLVISPFVKHVESQYQKRSKLFPHHISSVLPDNVHFDLIEAPLPPWEVMKLTNGRPSAMTSKMFSGDFFQRLQNMTVQMQSKEFDVALIGAGAFGLHLAATAKKMGKVALVLGGTLGTFFGIKSNRMDTIPVYTRFFYGDEWLRMEKPNDSRFMERAAYWRI